MSRKHNNLFTRLLIAGLFALVAFLLSSCNEKERQSMVGKWVQLSNVTTVDKMTVTSGWTATATSQDGAQHITVAIDYKSSVQGIVVNDLWAEIKTVPASGNSGTATITKSDGSKVEVTYYIR